MVKTGEISIPGFQHISPKKGSGDVSFVAVLCDVLCRVHINTTPGNEYEIFNHLKKQLKTEEA